MLTAQERSLQPSNEMIHNYAKLVRQNYLAAINISEKTKASIPDTVYMHLGYLSHHYFQDYNQSNKYYEKFISLPSNATVQASSQVEMAKHMINQNNELIKIIRATSY